MGKIAIWIFIGLAVLLLMRLFASAKRRLRDDEADSSAGGKKVRGEGEAARDAAPGPQGELILACAVCGVHIPSSDAVFARGRVYCSPEHRDQDRGTVPRGSGGDG